MARERLVQLRGPAADPPNQLVMGNSFNFHAFHQPRALRELSAPLSDKQVCLGTPRVKHLETSLQHFYIKGFEWGPNTEMLRRNQKSWQRIGSAKAWAGFEPKLAYNVYARRSDVAKVFTGGAVDELGVASVDIGSIADVEL